MARGNMIVTLVAQTKNFAKGMKDAGKSAMSFGTVVKAGMGLAIGALLAGAAAIFAFVPNLVKMAEEARKSELRLSNIATQMGLFGKNTKEVTGRISEYAERISFATGVDDELVRSGEAILMTFKNVAKSADTIGGSFDRATIAAVDLAAAGFGDVETNAKQLGKALNDPSKGLTSLRKAGVTFTEAETEKIKKLQESGKLLEAQNIILSAIETQVGGTAEATASATDKMQARFEAVGEQLGTALLPAVDTISTKMGEWLDSVEGKQAIKELTDELIAFGDWMTSPDGQKAVEDMMIVMKLFADSIIGAAKAVGWLIDAWNTWTGMDANAGGLPSAPGAAGAGGDVINKGVPKFAAQPNAGSKPGITVNVKGITPSAAIGKTVVAAVKDAQRLGRK